MLIGKKLVLFILIFLPLMVFSESEGLLNKLLAPGPLIVGHKHLEGTRCLDCHKAGKGLDESKCLQCHKEIQYYITYKHGFHGTQTKSCMECHSDHKGRDYDSTKVDQKTFDHSLTTFKLDGKHADIKCTDCHLEKRKNMKIRKTDIHFLGNTKSCNECHKKDDVHFFIGPVSKRLCSDCHTTSSWKKEINFDHNRDTKYKLEESHAKLKCMECHQLKTKTKIYKYQWPRLAADKCMSCHDEFHKNAMKSKWSRGNCLECHNQTKWKIEVFDHKKVGFELLGKHLDTQCLDCHKQKISLPPNGPNRAVWTGLKKTCNSCHKDIHEYGNFISKTLGKLTRCEVCHTANNWKTEGKFDHNENTHFPVDGRHVDIKCEGCHIPKSFKFESKTILPVVKNLTHSVYHFDKMSIKTCNVCHINPHTGVFSDKRAKMSCTDCHVTDGWSLGKGEGLFDHSKTRFKLTGAHIKAECKDCHLTKDNKKIYKFSLKLQGGCVDCHENIHLGQMRNKFSKKSCTECHTTQTWLLFNKPKVNFDHTLTRFKLTGKHSEINCKECHKEIKPHLRQFKFEKPELKFCISCHENVHKNQFSNQFSGKSCVECHNTQKFTQRLEFDHSKTDYPLRGKHAQLKCNECHMPDKELGAFKSGTEKGTFVFPSLDRKQCLLCHKDEHKGQFGNSCIQCHNENDWKATRDFHKNFMLSGIHLTLSCNECHKNDRHLSGTGTNCLFCHKKDDIHHGTLPTCGICHNQNFWDARVFQHSMTRFPLRGVHRTLDCLECHNRGIYRGTPTDCYSCHSQDAINATSMSHSPIANFTDCTSCHKNHFSFTSQK